MYDLILPETSRDHYNDRLRECAQERRALQVARLNGQDWTARLLLSLSAWLINTGVRLKEHVVLHPSLSQQ